MKKIKFIPTLIITMLICSCSILDKKPAIVDYWKGWVAEKVLSIDDKREFLNKYVNKKYDEPGGLNFTYLRDYTDDESGDAIYAEENAYLLFAELFLAYSKDWHSYYTQNYVASWITISKASFDNLTRPYLGNTQYWDNYSLYELAMEKYSWHPSFFKMVNRDVINNPEVFKDNMLTIYGEFDWFITFINEKVEVIQWTTTNSGNKHKIYDVIYHVNSKTYVLCQIMSSDNGATEIKVVKQSKYLLDLQ